MTGASVHAKQIFRRWIGNAPSSGQQHERRGSSGKQWMTGCFRANCGGNPGTATNTLEPPPHTHTLCFNALESSTANTVAEPSWRCGWHSFCWHGDVPLLEKEALSLCCPEKRWSPSSTGHTLSCVTLCDIVCVVGVWSVSHFMINFKTFHTIY